MKDGVDLALLVAGFAFVAALFEPAFYVLMIVWLMLAGVVQLAGRRVSR